MKSSDDLFRLVHSLTPAEKGYFKKYTQKHVIGQTNDYMILFRALDAMPAWDDAALQKRLKSSGFVHRISAVKNYLTKILLESLRSFHSESSIERTLLEMLADISFLWRRNLRPHAKKLILRAQALAYQYEEWELALKILQWQFVGIEATSLTAPMRKKFQTLTEEKLKILEWIRQTEELRALNDAVAMLNSREGMAGGNVAAELDIILAHPLLQNESLIHTYVGKLLFHNILVIAENLRGRDIRFSLPHARRRAAILQGRLDLIAEKPMVYIRGMNQYVQRCIFAGEFNEAEKALADFDATITNLGYTLYEAARIEAFIMKTNMEILYYLNSGKLDHGSARLADWQHGLDRHRKNMDLQLYRPMCFNICVLLAFNGQWTQALAWLHRTLDGGQTDIRRDIVSAAKLLEMVIHYELGNASLLEYSVRSMYRYLAKRERLGKVEQIVLRFLRKASRVISPRELRRYFMQLHHQLQLIQSPNEHTILDLFDFQLWLESKLSNQSLTQLFLQKLAAKQVSVP